MSAISVLLGVAVTVIVPLLFDSDESDNDSVQIADDLEITWIGTDGRYRIDGHVDNLAARQVIWVYNQGLPRQDERNSDGSLAGPGQIYPAPRFCPVAENGDFFCDSGYAGVPADAGDTFRFYAAVLDHQDAEDAAIRVHDSGGGIRPYDNENAILRIDGDRAIVSTESVKPGP